MARSPARSFGNSKGRAVSPSTKTDDEVRRFFEEEFPDAVPLMPALLEDFKTNPTGSLVTIRCAPWFYKDKVALVGDAAHAVVPFYGQGMNAAFEDCVVLDECLAEFPNDRQRAFAEYFARRKENADALADLAVHNFIEMRDKTASKSISRKEEARSSARRFAARNLSAALHHGHVHAHPLFRRRRDARGCRIELSTPAWRFFCC